MASNDIVSGMVERVAKRQHGRIEAALKDAILNDYDGVDVNYAPHTESYHIQSIEPWSGDPPDGANGYRTERYTWDWFDNEELKATIREGRMAELIDSLVGDGDGV